MSALWGVKEICDGLRVGKSTLDYWRRNHPDFPEPKAELAAGPVWDSEDVLAWHRMHVTARCGWQGPDRPTEAQALTDLDRHTSQTGYRWDDVGKRMLPRSQRP